MINKLLDYFIKRKEEKEKDNINEEQRLIKIKELTYKLNKTANDEIAKKVSETMRSPHTISGIIDGATVFINKMENICNKPPSK